MDKASKQAQAVKETVARFRADAARLREQADNKDRMAAAWERLQRQRERHGARELVTV